MQNTNDSGAGSLRQCLIDTPGGEITFASGANGTITLLTGLPTVTLTSSLTITGNGEASTVINGNSVGGFRFYGNHTVSVSNLTISGTEADSNGAALYSKEGDVVIANSTFDQNSAYSVAGNRDGGAIHVGLGGDLSISGSDFTYNNADGNGGAIYVYGAGTISIENSTFYRNDAEDRGGVVQVRGLAGIQGTMSVTGSDFDSNEASYGGAISLYREGNLSISTSTFTANYASSTSSSGGGGAVDVPVDADVSISDSTFTDNVAYYRGGAVSVDGIGALTVSDSYFGDNRTIDDAGGAIFRDGGGTLAVTASTFARNYAANDGGAIYADGTTATSLTVVDSTFQENISDDQGGALYVLSDIALEVTRSTFDSNTSASRGGAVYVESDSTATFTNSTFYNNNSSNRGGSAFYAMYSDVTVEMNFVTITGNETTLASSGAVHSNGTVEITNSIVFDNLGGDVRAPSASLTASYSLFTSSSSVYPTISGASLIFGEDPLLGALADNGGLTETMMPTANSPVIGRADPSSTPLTDQRGFSRTTNGLADMGAVEVGGVAPEPDLSQLPPSWFQATTRDESTDPCPAGMDPSWAEWANDRAGGWTCEWVTWWDVNKGTTGDWVTTPGFNVGRRPGQ